MTVKKVPVGKGMTRREVTRVEGTGASDIFPGQRAMVDPEDWAALGDILRTAGADPRSELRTIFEEIAGDRREKWLAAYERMTTTKTDEERERARTERDALPPPEVDSEQWFAETVLGHLDFAGKFRSMGQHDKAEMCAFQAGVTAGIAAVKFEWEVDALRGRDVLEGAKKGHETTHGTKEENRARWARFQKVVSDVRRDQPEISSAQLRRIASQRLKKAGEKLCQVPTLERRCTDPNPPHPRKN